MHRVLRWLSQVHRIIPEIYPEIPPEIAFLAPSPLDKASIDGVKS